MINMSKEARLGLFAIIVLAMAIWGYKYLKGQNILSKSYTFKTTYSDVSQLSISSPVLLNGLNVGSVTAIKINKENLSEMVVTFDIEKDYKIPKDAVALQVSDGIINGKAIAIKYDNLCSGANCAKTGDVLEGKVVGLLGSMVGQDEVNEYLKTVTTELDGVIAGLGAADKEGAVNEIILELNKSIKNIESMTRTTDALLKNSYSNLSKTMENMNTITTNLAQNNGQITSMLANLNDITADIKTADVGSTVTTTNETLAETKKAITQLQSTLTKTDDAMLSLKGIMTDVEQGNGSLGKLVNDEELYTNLEATSRNLSLLLQDLRLNPKRYVNVSIFGKKNKEYTLPENDPAETTDQ